MKINIESIGIIHSERLEPTDDHWNSVVSWIELNEEFPIESLEGLNSFSHIEVLYYFHKVDKNKIILSAEHPRENLEWPKVGIFAQRKKARPNLIGTTIVKLLKVDRKKIYIQSLDAIDGTPVLDIKPIFKEFLPNEEIIQPRWVNELMKNYW